MKTSYKILSFIILGIVFVSIGFGVLYPSPRLNPDERIPTARVLDPDYRSNEECAELFDKIFDTWKKYVAENYGGPGQPTLEPPTVAGLVSGWEGGEEFRNTDCRYRVNDWAYLVRHQEQVWGYIDWPKLEPFKYEPKPEPERTLPPEPPFAKEEPSTKIELMFGEKLEDGLVPVIVTEVTTHAEPLDEIRVWNFQLIGHSGDDRRIVWDTVPNDKRIWYEITDSDTGLDIIDYTRLPENYAIPSDLHVYEMDCDLFHTVSGESARPTSFPIKNNTSTIFAKNSWMGIYPDSKGDYSFEFASIFEHYVRFPEDYVEILSQESKDCSLTYQIDFDSGVQHSDGYYTKMVFRIK